ncbi:hypothetical protein QP028_01730 [Corynebacterium suedekumii]|nr:hypothetical protein QP028_01730 [Corynebacterium suedekumii]
MSQPDDTTPENTTEKKLTWEFPEDKPFTHNHPERPGKVEPGGTSGAAGGMGPGVFPGQ